MKQNDATNCTLKQCSAVLKVISAHSPTARAVVRALDGEKFEQLYDGTIGFPDTSKQSFPLDYFAYNLLRKYPFKGIDRKGVALAAFAAAEDNCRVTNERLTRAYHSDPVARGKITYLREKIRSVLGPFDWDAVERDFAWGPGATTRLANSEGDVYFKFRGKPETTLQNLPLSVAAVGRIPLWFGELHPLTMKDMFRVVPGSKITTVPKDAKTDRTIAIEPCMNMYIQKGIGSSIRRRLRRVGVDLNDQTVNQRLAAVAQRDGLATIDLSAASDSVSKKLVEFLLPDDWFSAVQQCRSPRYVLNSRICSFEKFSTMGNGYTFELESLIFWAIGQLTIAETFVADRSLAIYGDDIICHSWIADELEENLEFFGFSVNKSKSFTSGPFYESCGKHYFHGSDVTPVFVKAPVVQPLRMTWFANSIARWSARVRECGFRHVAHTAWIVSQLDVPEAYRLPIPEGVGDGGLVIPTVDRLDELPEDLRAPPLTGKMSDAYQRGYEYYHYCDIARNTVDRDPSDVPYLLRALYRLEAMPSFADRLLEAKDACASGILNVREVRKVRSWTSSWTTV